jgi:hypothetical protein
MGMICSLRRVGDAAIDHLLESPEEVESFLFGDEPVAPKRRGGLLGFLARLSPIKVETAGEGRAPTASPPDVNRESGAEIDLDKAWHGLHFLFTGTAWGGLPPSGFLLCGGEELGGDEEIGQGPPRAHRSAAVGKIAAFLENVTPAELERRFDPRRMTELEIYPDVIWTRTPPEDSPLEYLLASFGTLRTFVSDAARRGEGIIVYLT